MVKQSQMVGIQGKRRTTTKKVQKGLGTGGKLQLAFPSYTYDAESGFAEHDMEEYNRICAELAWSRSLAAARRAFGAGPDLEGILEQHVQSKSPAKVSEFPMLKLLTYGSRQVFRRQRATNCVGLHSPENAPCN